MAVLAAGAAQAKDATESQDAPIATTSLAAAAQAPTAAQGASVSKVQDNAQAKGQATTVQELVVTGTMFRRTSKETASPVTTVTADQIAKAGITTVSDAIRTVSADNSGSVPTAFGNGFAVGSSGVALRGLTVDSTLVLIDGLRTTNYGLFDDGERGFVDLNTISESMVERVEVLKDGASSLYGADAIGGVVNIIMKPQFQGFEASGDVGTSQGGGGATRRITMTAGKGDLDVNGWNAYVNAEYQADSPIMVGQRGFPYNTNNLSSIGGANNIGGQPGLFSGSTYGSVTPGYLSTPGNVTTGVPITGATSQILRPGGCGPGTTNVGGQYCEQDLLRYVDDQPQQERWGISGRLTKQFDANTRGYVSLSFNQDRVHVDGAPSQIEAGTPNNTLNIALPATLANGQLNPNNPFASQGEAALINYAFGDIPASTTETSRVMRAVFDLKGLALGWNYDASVVIAHSWLDTAEAGFIDYNQLISDVQTGAYNFINPSQNSAAVRAALSPTSRNEAHTNMDSFDAKATRTLFELPGGPLGLGLGAQFRYESALSPSLNPNAMYQGLGLAQVAGSHEVGSGYFELDAPFLKSLTTNLSGRLDDYSDFGSAFSPKFGFKWTPVRQLAIRGTWSRGFRAPSFAENGSSSAEGFVNYTPPTAYQTAHGNDGYVQQYQLAELTLANPHIKPETSQSFTGGVVYEPLRWASVSLDYYHIQKKDEIAPPTYAGALGAYYAGQALPPGYAITAAAPDSAYPGSLGRPQIISASYVNESSLTTDGLDIDVQIHRSLPHDFKLVSDFSGTDILHYTVAQPDGTSLNYVGLQSPYNLSSGAGTPQYRASWQTTLSRGPASVSGTLYYTSAMKMYGVDVAPYGVCLYSNSAGNPFPSNCVTKSFTDFDLTGSYQVNQHLQLFANMLNVFDTKPPLDPANYAGVNYNPTYAQAGIVGRYFKIGFTYKY